jgi:hypothetical protein
MHPGLDQRSTTPVLSAQGRARAAPSHPAGFGGTTEIMKEIIGRSLGM